MSKIAVVSFCLQALLLQFAFADPYIGPGSVVTNNAYVDNDLTVNNLGGGYGYGYPSAIYGMGNLGAVAGGVTSTGAGALAIGNAGLGGLYGNLGSIGYGNLGYGSLGYGNLGYGSIGYGGLGYGGLANGGVVSSSGFAPVPDVAAVTSLPATGPLVSNGYAELGVAGAISALGTTIVTGQVPVMGAVSFSGGIPASGVVSIAGNCGCGGLQF